MAPRLALSTAIVAFAASAAAQITSSCDPLKSGVNACPADPAFGSQKVTVDFTQGASDVFNESTGAGVTYGSNGAVFTISQEGQAPSMTSKNYLFFGTVDVTLQVAAGQGIVTTFFLESDDGDEIDWEWLGGSDKNSFGQSNWFSGKDIVYVVNEKDLSIASPQTEMHTYTIDWSPTQLVWKVDGTALRTLTYAGNEDSYPQTPMQVKLGTWCGGCSSSEGTVEWAGGAPDWSQAPFIGYYKTVVIQDSSNGVANAVSYQYTDQSGSMKSIQVNTGGAGATDAGSGNNAGESRSSSDLSSTTDPAVSDTQSGTASTLLTVTSATAASSDSVSADATTAQATGTASVTKPLAETAASAAATGSDSSATGSSGASSPTTTVAASEGQKSAVNLAFLGAFMFALIVL